MSRIRFAPLPDPHVLTVHDADDDDDSYDLEPESESPRNSKLLFPFTLPGGRRPGDASSSASSSMHSLTPIQSIDSTAPATKKSRLLRLLRLSNKDSALTRSSSINSFGSSATTDSLYRTQSTTSYRGGNVRSAKPSTKPRPTKGLLSEIHNDRRPQRMLNGRVYGERKNLFASAPDTSDEFAEWRGMGSVKSNREVAGRVWDKLQTNAGIVADEEDDGGGMSWVKRRKEERERKAREEAEKQAEEVRQKEHNTRAVNVPMHEDVDEEDGSPTQGDADEGDEGSPVEDDSPDDEDEDPLDAEARKTSLGAGVEKISRHHKT